MSQPFVVFMLIAGLLRGEPWVQMVMTAESGVLPDLKPILLPVSLCNDAQLRAGEVIGDPMEGALLAIAIKAGLDPEQLQKREVRVAEIPFDTEHKYHATFHLDGDRIRIMIKGAPEVLLSNCKTLITEDGEQPLDAAQLERLEKANEKMASTGLRILAVAMTEFPARNFVATGDLSAHVKDLVFTGMGCNG